MKNIIMIECLTFGLGKLSAAAEKYGCCLYLLTHDPSVYDYELTNISSSCLKVIIVDTFDYQKIKECLTTIDNIVGIFNTTDTWSEFSINLSKELGLEWQNSSSITLTRNKYLLREKLVKAGLSKSQYYLFDKENQESFNLKLIQFPVIVKELHGTGSRNVYFVNSEKELEIVIATSSDKVKKFQIETFFKGPLYSAETLSYKGDTNILAISGRILSKIPCFREESVILPIRSPIFSDLENWIQKIFKEIGFSDGFAHTEFIVTENGFEVVEVNARLGGGLIGESLCKIYQKNIYEANIQMILGEKPTLFDLKPIEDCYIAFTLVYSTSIGKFLSLDNSLIVQNNCHIFPCAKEGKSISQINDQSACVAIVLCQDSNPNVALLNSISESNRILVKMENL